MARFANVNWNLPADERGDVKTWEALEVALLMDLRDELRALNAKLAGVGPTVHDIERNTRGIRRCRRCGRGPYITERGLVRHVQKVHLVAK